MEPDEKLFQVYTQIFETWRSQVDSYWQRSNYFAAFETAAIAGCWHILSRQHDEIWAGGVVSILGIALTIVWLYNNHKTHGYVLYWWESLRVIESKLDVAGTDFVTQQKGGGLPPYRYLIQIVPIIFLMAWSILFIWSLLLSCTCKGPN